MVKWLSLAQSGGGGGGGWGVEGYSVLFIHCRSFSVGCAASCDICFLSNHISTFCVARLKEICPKAFRIRSGALKYMAIPTDLIGWLESEILAYCI